VKYIRFYFDHWACSTRMLSLEAKGAWLELMVAMSTQKEPGKLEASIDQIARLWGVTCSRAEELLSDLEMANVCKVQFGDKVSVECREIIKSAKDHEEYAKKRSEAGRIGGQASAKARAQRIVNESSTIAQANVKQSSSKCSTNRQANVNHTTKLLTTNTTKANNSLKKAPTLDEIKAFCASRSLPESRAEAFFNYYEGHNLWRNKNGELIKWFHMIQNKPWNEDRHNDGKNGSGSVRVNRNSGTANDGDFSEFANVGKVARD
jgi:uncharacterized protein YdaU (DUF1376 family)